jgi:hypothetical protein
MAGTSAQGVSYTAKRGLDGTHLQASHLSASLFHAQLHITRYQEPPDHCLQARHCCSDPNRRTQQSTIKHTASTCHKPMRNISYLPIEDSLLTHLCL